MTSRSSRSQVRPFALLLTGLLLLSAKLSAQIKRTAPQYTVVKLGSLGGTVGRSNAVNDRGWVSGWWNLPGDAHHHAVLWIDGHANDLGTLGGPNSQIEFIATNDFGTPAGESDTSDLDPYGENFCFLTASVNFLCSAFCCENEVMSAHPGLGGNNSFATNSNKSGHIVGCYRDVATVMAEGRLFEAESKAARDARASKDSPCESFSLFHVDRRSVQRHNPPYFASAFPAL